MPQTNEAPPLGAAGLGNAFPGGKRSNDIDPNADFLQMPLPSFFEMVGENSAFYLRNITTYACLLFIDASDPESFADARAA